MSHFLARLVDRARGKATCVQPMITPQFAPNESLDIPPRSELAGPHLAASSSPISPPNESLKQADRQVVSLPPPPPLSVPPPDQLLVPQFNAREEKVAPNEKEIIRETVARERTSELRIRETARVLLEERHVATPREVPNESSATVQVTIGSIEVRAIQPTTRPQSKPRPRTSSPSLTLDGYLDSRKKGAR